MFRRFPKEDVAAAFLNYGLDVSNNICNDFLLKASAFGRSGFHMFIKRNAALKRS